MLRIDRSMQAYDKKPRKNHWVGIIIHHTDIGGRKEISDSLWDKLGRNISLYLAKKDNNYVSAHYTIAYDGLIRELVNPDQFVAYHAGKSKFYHPIYRKEVRSWNEYAIV